MVFGVKKACLLGGFLKMLAALFDILAGTFHGVAAGETKGGEQESDHRGDFKSFHREKYSQAICQLGSAHASVYS